MYHVWSRCPHLLPGAIPKNIARWPLGLMYGRDPSTSLRGVLLHQCQMEHDKGQMVRSSTSHGGRPHFSGSVAN